MAGPTFAAEAKKQFTSDQMYGPSKLAADIESLIDSLDKAIKRVQVFQQVSSAK